jgi:superfamily II DNA or RNA helicase
LDSLIDACDGGELLVSDEPPSRRITLRPYQREANELVWKFFFEEQYDRLLGEAATGSGKTVMFADLAQRMLAEGRGRTLVLADQDELIEQAVAKIRDTTGILADVEKAERRASLDSDVVVSTIQSMRSRLAKFPADHFGLVVADEADRSIADQWALVLEHFTGAKKLGVTATPDRADRRSIMSFYQRKAFAISLFDLIRMRYLSRISVRTIPLKIDISKVSQTRGDYDSNQLATSILPYYAAIADAIKEFAGNRKTLVFHPLISSSQKFTEVALDRGLAFKHIDGQSPDRRLIQQQFRDGKIRGMSNALLLSRGYDDPSIDCIVNLRPTRHATMYRQIVGRGTRIFCPRGCSEACNHAERKRDLLILDFLWQFERFNVMRPANLIAKDAQHADALQRKFERSSTQLDLQVADSEVAREIEEALINEFNRSRKRKGEYFDALEWAATMGQRELIDYEPETAYDAQPMTEQQKTRLQRAGFVVESVKGYAHAAQIINVLNQRMKKKLATFKQVHYLRRFGVKDALNVGFEEASQILSIKFADENSRRSTKAQSNA